MKILNFKNLLSRLQRPFFLAMFLGFYDNTVHTNSFKRVYENVPLILIIFFDFGDLPFFFINAIFE